MTDDERVVLALVAERQPIRLPPLLEIVACRMEQRGFVMWTVGGWFVTDAGRVALRLAMQTKH
jgi:hypothetical protein